MDLFTAVAGVLALATALILVRPLVAGRRAAEGGDSGDTRLYRDQLDEVDRDLARGTIGAAEAEGARAEVSRRLIAAAARAETAGSIDPAPAGRSRLVAGAALVLAPALAVAVYLGNGAPGLPDLPLASRPAAEASAHRPSQEQAEAMLAASGGDEGSSDSRTPEEEAGRAEYLDLVAKLEKVVKDRPDDMEGLRLLAGAYMQLDRAADAWRVYASMIRLGGEAAEPELYSAQLDAMVQAAGGYVSPEAEALLMEAIGRASESPVVRYYSGLLFAQKGRLDDAIHIWESLKAEAPKDAPWLAFLDSMLAEAKAIRAQSGPVAASPAPAAPGPNAAQVEAAAGMSADERQSMIEGMVARLENRLTDEGGTVEEWVRLINAYVQLGRPADAQRIYDLGRTKLAAADAGILRQQAQSLGVQVE